VKTAELYSDGEDGRISYIIQENDISEYGMWHCQAMVKLPSGTWRTNVERFHVYPNIEIPVVIP